MATFAEKPSSYTVNTAHAKCPDHLYMIDEGSGSTLTDRGKATGLNLTLNDSSVWTTADLTTGGGTSPAITCGTGKYGLSATSFSVTNHLLVVAIYASDDGTNPAARESVAGIGGSAANSNWALLASSTSSDGKASARFAGTASNAKNDTADTWDAGYHMGFARFTSSGGNITVAIRTEATTFGTASASSTAFSAAYNRIGIGVRPTSSLTELFSGTVVAVMIYKELDAATVTDAWCDSLAADPWQFLTTTATYVKWLAAPSAAGASNIAGAVYDPDDKTLIGTFSGQAFDATLTAGGEAVLYIPCSEISPDGDTLTTADAPLIVAYNATLGQVGFPVASVIEE